MNEYLRAKVGGKLPAEQVFSPKIKRNANYF